MATKKTTTNTKARTPIVKKETKKEVKDTRVISSSGLKSRTLAAPRSGQVKNKPNKMKLRKPNRMPDRTIDFSNPALLVFPSDRRGLTTRVKKAMISAASAVGTDEANLKLLDETLEILTKHVHARYNQNAKMIGVRTKLKSIGAVGEIQAQIELDLGAE